VQQTSLDGDCRCLLSVCVTEQVADRNAIEVAQRLCHVVGVRALLSDASVDPYTMILIDRTATPRPVTLDVDSLNQRGEYRLSDDCSGHC
jgi:hypothetical protein